MKKVVLQILVVFLLAVSISAQVEENQPGLIDEWGKVNLEEIMAQLNSLTIELEKKTNTKLFIKIYGGDANYFSSPYLRGSLITSFLRNNMKLAPEKYSIEYCNVNKGELWTKFFILPQNEQPSKCEENLELPATTVLFERVYFLFPDFKLKSLENSSVYIDSSAGGEYSEISQGILKRLLNSSPESKVYIIAYLQTNFEIDENGKTITKKTSGLDKKWFAKSMTQAARTELIKNGFLPSQIVTIDGGYINGNERRLEFWFVPKGGEIPKPQPDYIPRKVK